MIRMIRRWHTGEPLGLVCRVRLVGAGQLHVASIMLVTGPGNGVPCQPFPFPRVTDAQHCELTAGQLLKMCFALLAMRPKRQSRRPLC
jgi:hypothetical protein